MEWTLQRSIDGALLLNCDDEFGLLAQWLEHHLQQQANFAQDLLQALQALQGNEAYTLDQAGYRFIATTDEIQLIGNQDQLLDAHYDEQALQVEQQHNCCGYDDFLLLLDSIAQF